jgi:two-component system cell cycle response regulator CtrA
MRVLLIEDEATVAQSIELMLKSENFNTYTTDLGEEGVDLGKLYEYNICPSSDDLRRFAVLRNGGSGPPWLRG